jgi:hypothetical protein
MGSKWRGSKWGSPISGGRAESAKVRELMRTCRRDLAEFGQPRGGAAAKVAVSANSAQRLHRRPKWGCPIFGRPIFGLLV